jgi:hypothetical protein
MNDSMSVIDARNVILAFAGPMKSSGGGSGLATLIRRVGGFKFGSFKPTELADVLSSDDIATRIIDESDKWIQEWEDEHVGELDDEGSPLVNPRVAASVLVSAWVDAGGFDLLSKAINSLVAKSAYQLTLVDKRGNKYVETLQSLLTTSIGLGVNRQRAASLTTPATAKADAKAAKAKADAKAAKAKAKAAKVNA